MDSDSREFGSIVLQPKALYWLGDDAVAQAEDQCAHGRVGFSIGEIVFAPDAVGGGDDVTVSAAVWRIAVLGFCDEVQAFYDRSPPRITWEGEDGDGWRAFWDEWLARRAAAA